MICGVGGAGGSSSSPGAGGNGGLSTCLYITADATVTLNSQTISGGAGGNGGNGGAGFIVGGTGGAGGSTNLFISSQVQMWISHHKLLMVE